ncbi:MAG: cobalt ECF transporter T component CbiQ [Eubacterium sp.]
MKFFLSALGILCIVGFIYWLRHRDHQVGHKHRHKHQHNGSVFSIDVIAYNSKINFWNPGFKVGFSLILLLLCIIANSLYISVLVILITGYVTIVMGGVSFRDYLGFLTVPIAFLIMGSIAILLNFSSTPLGLVYLNCHFFYIYISEESLSTTLYLWGKAFGAVSAMYMMSLSTPSTEIFGVLGRIHVPKLVIELMNMIYRYIFILMDTQAKMKNSAESRLGYCDFKTAVYSFGHSMSNLFVVSMKKASQYFDAMEARCYDGELSFLEAEKPLKKNQVIPGILVIILLMAVWILNI